MSRKKTVRDYAKDAAAHHSTLNAFGAVVALLEGGLLYDAAANRTAQQIIRLCHKETRRQLGKYDAAIAKTGEPQ